MGSQVDVSVKDDRFLASETKRWYHLLKYGIPKVKQVGECIDLHYSFHFGYVLLDTHEVVVGWLHQHGAQKNSANQSNGSSPVEIIKT